MDKACLGLLFSNRNGKKYKYDAKEEMLLDALIKFFLSRAHCDYSDMSELSKKTSFCRFMSIHKKGQTIKTKGCTNIIS